MKGKKAFEALKAHALTYPGTFVDHPWGETVVKVAKKVFIFMGVDTASVGLSVKLPQSKYEALDLPFCKPTGYGLGKAGWISASFEARNDVPVEMLKAWIDESYRAIAPKTLVKALDSGEPKKKTVKKTVKKVAKKTAKKVAKALPKKKKATR